MEVRVGKGGLYLGDTLVPLVSGAVHYWRLDRGRWEALLDMVAEMGFGMVETYVPWSVHEVERGRFDFGDTDRSKALPEFIRACHERGLYLIVRPGPHINAELTLFGYPERVLRDEQCLSVSVDGDKVWMPIPPKMWPAPSYASEAFYRELGLWFDALAPILKKELAAEGGPVVAVQLDNEFCNMFRNSAWDHDYHPDSLELWKKFISDKRGKAIEAPREFKAEVQADLPLYLDWIEFKEFYMRNALSRLRSMWEERGIRGVPFFSNYPVGHDVPPSNWAELEKVVDFHGPDMYPTRKQYYVQKALTSFASGLSRLPYMPEFSSGGFFWSAPVSIEDQRFTTPACFMHGIKGVNFYMLVERERWYGSPISRDGRKRQAYWDLFEDFNRWFKRTRVNELEKQSSILLLSVRDYERLSLATTLLDPAPPLAPYIVGAGVHCLEENFGFEDVIPISYETHWQALFNGLSSAKVPFDCGNTSQALSSLKRYAMVLCPTFEFLDQEVQQKLLDYAQAGGVLVIGPRLPRLDSAMEPCEILRDACGMDEPILGERARECTAMEGRIVIIPKPLQKGFPRERRTTLQQANELVHDLCGRFNIRRPYLAEDHAIETVLYEGGGRRVLFVANPTDEQRQARIGSGGAVFIDAQSDEEFRGEQVEVPMPPYTIRILEIDPGAGPARAER